MFYDSCPSVIDSTMKLYGAAVDTASVLMDDKPRPNRAVYVEHYLEISYITRMEWQRTFLNLIRLKFFRISLAVLCVHIPTSSNSHRVVSVSIGVIHDTTNRLVDPVMESL